MFSLMRQLVKPILWLVVLSFLVTIFAGWGMKGCQRNDPRVNAAIVDGEPIPRDIFQRVFDNQMSRRRNSTDAELTEDEVATIRQQALDGLIKREVLLKEAKDRGILVTDDEIRKYVQYDPMFRDENGAYDEAKFKLYRDQVPARHWAAFEEEKRQLLLQAKLRDSVTSNLRVSRTNLETYFRTFFKKFTLQQILIDPRAFIADTAVQEYYLTHADDYLQPVQVHARHILISVPENAPDEAVQQARRKIQNIHDQIEDGQIDFAEAARRHSDDKSNSENGGDLGTFGEGVMVAPFEEVAFSLDPGTLSTPVRTKFGFHLIEVLERLEGLPYPLEKVEDNVRYAMLSDTDWDAARVQAEACFARLESGEAFVRMVALYSDALSADSDGNLGTVSRFIEATPDRHADLDLLHKELIIGNWMVQSLSEHLETIAPGSFSQPIRSPFGWHIVKVLAVEEANFDDFASFRTNWEAALNQQLREDLYASWYEHIKAHHDIKVLMDLGTTDTGTEE